MVSGDNGYGIIDSYGNVIVPTQFGSFDTSFDVYENGGYFLSIGNEQTVFVTAGGNVTGSFNYGYNNAESVMGYGMSARVKTSDGKYLLLSADGRESDLGTTYEYMNVIKESKGMLWIGQPTDGNGYDLIDWHGMMQIPWIWPTVPEEPQKCRSRQKREPLLKSLTEK